MKRREAKGKGEKERYTHLNAEFQRIAKRVKKDFFRDQSPCLFNLCAEYMMQNAGLDESKAGIKIAWRNINNLRFADDTTLMAKSKELKRLLMKEKEESENVGLTFRKLRSWHPVPSLHGK